MRCSTSPLSFFALAHFSRPSRMSCADWPRSSPPFLTWSRRRWSSTFSRRIGSPWWWMTISGETMQHGVGSVHRVNLHRWFCPSHSPSSSPRPASGVRCVTGGGSAIYTIINIFSFLFFSLIKFYEINFPFSFPTPGHGVTKNIDTVSFS